jgi:RNA polymerase sigma-70 factor (ECF subfamily)
LWIASGRSFTTGAGTASSKKPQDVKQIVLLKLARTLPEFIYDPTRSFRAWLRTITLHTWSDFIESQRRGVAAAGSSAVTAMLHTVQARDDLLRRLQEGFDQDLVERAMELVQERVEAHTWEAFRLSAIEGVGASDVAAKLGMRIGSVYKARSVVQGMLRDTVGALKGEEG